MTDSTRATARSSHVYPVDLVRVLTFGAVIAVHTISTVNPLDSVPGDAVVMLLHFTREAFFFLTAFVLVHRYGYNTVRARPFWRRRFLLVGVPYVVWSLIYSAIGLAAVPEPVGQATVTVLRSLSNGMAWFHLYFLLVSLQFYLVFPLFQWLLRVTRGRHLALLAVSAALQVVIDLQLHDAAPTGLHAALAPYLGSFVFTYQFFLLLGGLAALHRARLDAWVRRHPRTVLAAFVVTGVAAEGQYLWSLRHGVAPEFASDVFQPVMIPWSIAVVAVYYALGAAWADRRAGGPASRFVERAADRSFGVFLVHPVILWLLTAAGPTSPAALVPAPWNSVAVYLVAVAGSLLIVELVRLTPLSLAMTGKRRARPVAAPSVAPTVAQPATAAAPPESAPAERDLPNRRIERPGRPSADVVRQGADPRRAT
jgi:peptidoglycan/LPS O-acetylase OafA/YrhL